MDEGTWTEVSWLHGGACREMTLEALRTRFTMLQPGAVCFLDILEGCEIVFRLQFGGKKR